MQFGEVHPVVRWIERHESLGSQPSVRGDDPSQSAIAPGSLRPRQGGAAHTPPSPQRRLATSVLMFFQVEIHGGTRLGQELIHEMLVQQWIGQQHSISRCADRQSTLGAEVGELHGKLRAVRFTRP
jgi:hypothetical protein